MEIAGWISYKIITYAAIPACSWAGVTVGTTVGAHVGKKIANNVMTATKNKISGKITIGVKKSGIYIINNGEIIEVNPRKKYIIEKGKISITSDDIYDLADIRPINDNIIKESSYQTEDDGIWTKI
ncbi:hypothetical protein PV-S19_0040 [Pacmanvirus S19]|nr:hypothetical protein PV-S19_0040 [Pacmanvirus S19]